MNAADIMTHPVIAVGPDMPLQNAIRMMGQKRISGLPVVDHEGRLVGMVTEGDLLRRVETGTQPAKPGWLTRFLFPGSEAEDYVRSRARRVGDIMTPDVLSAGPETPLRDIVTMMLEKHIKRVPITQGGKLLGIVSRADIVAKVGESMAEPVASASDESIKAAIQAAMDKESWSPRVSITVEVKDGVVELDGCVFDIRIRDAAGVAAETAPGVKSVENRIVCIEPYTGMITFDPEQAS